MKRETTLDTSEHYFDNWDNLYVKSLAQCETAASNKVFWCTYKINRYASSDINSNKENVCVAFLEQ